MPDGVIHGPSAAVDLVVAAGIDGNAVFNFQLRNIKNLSPAEIIGRAASSIGRANERIAARWGALWFVTDVPWSFDDAGVGGGSETPDKVEFKDPDPVRGAVAGHMLTARRPADALAWTEEYLEDAYEAQLMSDLRVINTRWENRVDGDILRRMFSDEYIQVGAGYSVPWPTASSNPLNFVPPAYGMYNFDDAHDHFIADASALDGDVAAAGLNEALAHLVHHGINAEDEGRFIALVSQADIVHWMAMPNRIQYIPVGTTVVGGSADAPVFVQQRDVTGVPGQAITTFISNEGPLVEVRASPRVPQNYAWVGKSYGDNDSRNPFAALVGASGVFGMMAEPILKHNPNPSFDRLNFKAGKFGANVNARLNGVAMRFGNASWANPVIGMVTA